MIKLLIIPAIFFLTVGVYVNWNNPFWLVYDIGWGVGLLFLVFKIK